MPFRLKTWLASCESSIRSQADSDIKSAVDQISQFAVREREIAECSHHQPPLGFYRLQKTIMRGQGE